MKIIYYWKGYPDGRVGDVYRCRECGLIFRSPELDKSGKRILSTNYQFRPDAPARFDERRRGIYLRILKEMEEYRKLNRVLDVGSGYGHFLGICINNGWHATGIEPSGEYAEFSTKELEIHAINVSFEKADLPFSSFDVVTFINVLEHLPDPLQALIKANRLLRSGGAVFIRTPNAFFHTSIRYLAYKGYHYWRNIRKFDVSSINSYVFNKKTLSRYLRKADFTYISVVNDGAVHYTHNSNKYSSEKVARKALTLLADIVEFSTLGRCLAASSLLFRASN